MNKEQIVSGLNNESIQNMNRSLILRLLRKMRDCSRADLAKSSGLKQATITNIINGFIKLGIVKETGLIEGRKGRRSIGTTLNAENYGVIGVRLTRKYFSVCLFDIYSKELNKVTEPLNILDGTKIALKKIKTAIQKNIEFSQQNKILGIGFAIPGPFIRTEGRIALMTEFPGWEKVMFQEEIQESFDYPIYFEHDANAGALAEWLIGSHSRESGIMIYVAAGQGIGAGIIINGKLIRGSVGISGEIGHMSISFNGPRCLCGNQGCFEQYCSTLAVVKEIKNKLKNHPSSILTDDCSFEDVIKAIKKGDQLALQVIEKASHYLGFGLVNIVNILNPDIIIIGDDLSQAGYQLLKIVRKTVKEHILPTIYENIKIELCSFKKDPVLLGISALVVDKTFQNPSLIMDL